MSAFLRFRAIENDLDLRGEEIVEGCHCENAVVRQLDVSDASRNATRHHVAEKRNLHRAAAAHDRERKRFVLGHEPFIEKGRIAKDCRLIEPPIVEEIEIDRRPMTES